MSNYRPHRFQFTWWHLVVALALIALAWCSQGCRDQYPTETEPCDAARLVGKWQGMESPFWLYDFHYPRLTQWVEIGGTVVTEQHYIYGTSADTLWASGPGGERMWLVCFPNDSVCEYREWDVWKWSPVNLLRRK